MENLNKEISNLEKYGKCCEGYLIDNITIVKVSIWLFIYQAEYFEPTPTWFQDIHEIKSISDYGSHQNVDCKENDENFHLFHVPFILEMLIFPFRGLRNEPSEGNVDDT